MNKKPKKDIYYFDLTPDEEVILMLRRHPITTLPWISAGLFMALMPIVVWGLTGTVGASSFFGDFQDALFLFGGVWYLVTVGFVFESFIVWYFNVYILTTRRVIDIDVRGIMHKNVAETPLSNVQDATFTSEGFGETIFNYGDVFIQTAGTEPEFDFHAVSRPDLVHDIITDRLGDYKSSV